MNHHNPYAVTHELQRVRFTLELPTSALPGVVRGTAIGESEFRRAPLWAESTSWNEREDDARHAPADWLHHLALTALQDRPNSQERLLFGLTGGLGVQDPLF